MIHRLDVFHLGGYEQVATVDELRSVLGEQPGGGNHFEIAPSPTSHPVLTLMVHGDLAVLHYFGSADDAGWQSRGNLHAVRAVVELPDPAGSVVTLPGATVVDIVTAERCVINFATSLSRPELVDWLPL